MRALILAISLLAASSALAQTPQSATPAPKTSPPTVAVPVVAAPLRATPMDINSASAAELQTLKGLGDVRAAAIIKGRPYKGKDDLVQKKILTQSVYDGIKDQIIAKQK